MNSPIRADYQDRYTTPPGPATGRAARIETALGLAAALAVIVALGGYMAGHALTADAAVGRYAQVSCHQIQASPHAPRNQPRPTP